MVPNITGEDNNKNNNSVLDILPVQVSANVVLISSETSVIIGKAETCSDL